MPIGFLHGRVERTRRGARARVAVALAAAAAISRGLLTAPASAAGQAAPTGLDATGVPILTWEPASGAVRYELEVDGDPSFSSPEFTAKTVNTRSVPNKRLAGGLHYWRVRATSPTGATSAWTDSEFDLGPLTSPSALLPDGDVLHQPDEPPLLSWTGVQGATSYIVELDTDPDFVGTTTYSTQTTSLVIKEPLEAGDYYWRVTASFGSGVVSEPSYDASFDVEPLDPVVLTSPEDDPNTEVTDVVLDWEPVPGAQYYQLRVARDADFNTIIDNQTKVFGTRYSPATTYNNAQYYWQVRAVDLAGKPTQWTTVQNSFGRVWRDRVEPIFPVGDVASPEHFGGEPYFQWTPVPHASHYQLDAGSDANFSPGTYTTCLVAGTTYTVGNLAFNGTQRANEKCAFVPFGVTYWRVRPMDEPYSTTGVQGLYTPTQAVIWDETHVDNLSPANETVDIPTLSWEPVAGVEKYKVELRDDHGRQVKSATTYSPSYTPTGISKLAAGDYSWTIQALDAANRGSVTWVSDFSVSGLVPESGQPPLTALSGTDADAPTLKAPNLTWEPYPGADHYRLFIGDPVQWGHQNGDVLGQDLPYPAVTDTSIRLFQPGSYPWFVKAYDASGLELATGPTNYLQIAGFGEVSGQSVALEGQTLDGGGGCTAALNPDGVTGDRCDDVPATPVFDWDPIEGMSTYILYLSNDPDFSNLVEAPASTNTRFALTFSDVKKTLPDSQAGQSYFWFVRPCKAKAACGPDPVSSTGMATNALRKLSPSVVLETPGADETIDTSEVTFDWEDYFDTNQATTFDATGESSHQSGMQYRIQVDDSPTFSSPLDNQLVDQSTYTADDRLYTEGQLYWRVKAVDIDGNGLAWSEVRSFVKNSPRAALVSPIDDAQVPGTTPFRWEPQPFNSSYRIEVYKNNDTTFSSTNRLFFKDVTTTAYAWDQPIPASDQPYVWRVRRSDSSKNPTQWSETGRFYSAGAAPTPLTPADGEEQPSTAPLFTWGSVPGATSYQLEAKTTSGLLVRVTTPSTAYAMTSAVPDGSFTWKVTALDVRNHVMGVSEVRSFQVDTSVPSVMKYAPQSKAKAKANVVVTFNKPVAGVGGRTFKLFQKGRKKKLAAVVKLNTAGTRATLNPKTNLKRGKTYVAKVTSGIKDTKDNPLAAFRWTFKV